MKEFVLGDIVCCSVYKEERQFVIIAKWKSVLEYDVRVTTSYTIKVIKSKYTWEKVGQIYVVAPNEIYLLEKISQKHHPLTKIFV